MNLNHQMLNATDWELISFCVQALGASMILFRYERIVRKQRVTHGVHLKATFNAQIYFNPKSLNAFRSFNFNSVTFSLKK